MLLRVPSETCARLKQGTETYRPRTNAFLFRLITEKNLMMVLSRVVIEPKNLNILCKKKNLLWEENLFHFKQGELLGLEHRTCGMGLGISRNLEVRERRDVLGQSLYLHTNNGLKEGSRLREKERLQVWSKYGLCNKMFQK